MSPTFAVNSRDPARLFSPDWRRLARVLAGGALAVAVLTPLLVGLGASAPRTAVNVLRFSVLALLALGARHDLLRESGLGACARPLAVWFRGFFCGAIPLALWVVVLLLLGERRPEWRGAGPFLLEALKYLPLSFLIGFAEDLLFFGLAWSALGRRVPVAAAFYALAHFLKPEAAALGTGPLVGLEALAAMGARLAAGLASPVELAGLLIVGWVLASLRRASGSIWPAMGVHGGWYLVRQLAKEFSDDVAGRHEWLFGTSLFYDGALGYVAIVATGVILIAAMRRRAWLRGEESG